MPQVDGYSTHLPLLGACLELTSGPVLELGCGNYSTPFLHAMCGVSLRRLVSVDFDEGWYTSSRRWIATGHEFMYVPADVPLVDVPRLVDVPWSLVLVDQEPAARRLVDVQALRAKTNVFILHDSENPEYGYQSLDWKYSYEWKHTFPWTRVVSDFHGYLFTRLKLLDETII